MQKSHVKIMLGIALLLIIILFVAASAMSANDAGKTAARTVIEQTPVATPAPTISPTPTEPPAGWRWNATTGYYQYYPGPATAKGAASESNGSATPDATITAAETTAAIVTPTPQVTTAQATVASTTSVPLQPLKSMIALDNKGASGNGYTATFKAQAGGKILIKKKDFPGAVPGCTLKKSNVYLSGNGLSSTQILEASILKNGLTLPSAGTYTLSFETCTIYTITLSNP